jgi:hypothetical protein
MFEAEQILPIRAGEPDERRYQLQHLLGENPGRQTWLAQDLIQSETVVIKLLVFGGTMQWKELTLFEREAMLLRQLRHPRIPQYRDSFTIDDRILWFGLVQEYIVGSSLRDLLHQGKRFSEPEVRRIATQILVILKYLHGLNPQVLHRDIKPSNLIVGKEKDKEKGKDNAIYLVDFGGAQDRSTPAGSTFTVVGTYGYAPLEQFGGRALPASDLYALGATLVHLLTGIPPAELPQQDMRLQWRDRVTVTDHFSHWLSTLLEPSVEKRFQSAQVAIKALTTEQTSTAQQSALQTASSEPLNTSGQGAKAVVPDEILGWNWGAFLMPNFWFMTNGVWWGVLTWIPLIGYIPTIILGLRGNQAAWQSRRWRNVTQFKTHQQVWTVVGLIIGLPQWGIIVFSYTMLIWSLFGSLVNSLVWYTPAMLWIIIPLMVGVGLVANQYHKQQRDRLSPKKDKTLP